MVESLLKAPHLKIYTRYAMDMKFLLLFYYYYIRYQI